MFRALSTGGDESGNFWKIADCQDLQTRIIDCQDHQPRIIDCQDHQLLIVRITKGGKLDDLNMAPDSSPFIDSVTRQDSFDGEDDEPGVEGMEVVGKAVEVATPLGTRYM